MRLVFATQNAYAMNFSIFCRSRLHSHLYCTTPLLLLCRLFACTHYRHHPDYTSCFLVYSNLYSCYPLFSTYKHYLRLSSRLRTLITFLTQLCFSHFMTLKALIRDSLNGFLEFIIAIVVGTLSLLCAFLLMQYTRKCMA
jgi:hypothetical protein